MLSQSCQPRSPNLARIAAGPMARVRRVSGASTNRRQRFELRRHRAACRDQIRDEALVDIEIAFIFTKIANLVTLGEQAPRFGPEAKRVRQHLEHDVPIGRPEATVPQCCETKRMGCVVDEIEAPFERICEVARIFEPYQAGPLQAGDLLRIRRLGRQCLARAREMIKRRCHPRFQSPRSWAGSGRASRMRCPGLCACAVPSCCRRWD